MADTKKEDKTFEVVLNPETDLAGYEYAEPVLAADKEGDEATNTVLKAGVPRRATAAEFDRLRKDEVRGTKAVVKVE